MTTKTYSRVLRWDELTERLRKRHETAEPIRHNDSQKTGHPWHGTADVSEALSLMEYGWAEGAERLTAKLAEIEPAFRESVGGWELDVAGYFPSVPAYVAGDPECMWIDAGEAELPRLTLAMTAGFPGSIDPEQAQTYAVALAALARQLEAAGNQVALLMLDKNAVSTSAGALTRTGILVRDFGEPLDLDRVAMTFHPSFLRRAVFAHRELWANSKAEPEADRKSAGNMRRVLDRGYGFSLLPEREDVAELFGEEQAEQAVILPRVYEVENLLSDPARLAGRFLREVQRQTRTLAAAA